MKNWKDLISSGLLELYVLGETSEEEDQLISALAIEHSEISAEIDSISIALEQYALTEAIQPDPIIKPFLLATIDYMDRMENGEAFSSPPLLDDQSSVADYQEWLNRTDMILPIDFDEVHAKILSATPELTTAIVWIKHIAPQEVHDHEYEKFLILEGTCDIQIEEQVFHLVPGDYLSIPLHKKHHVLVTSTIPCKVILQRVAA